MCVSTQVLYCTGTSFEQARGGALGAGGGRIGFAGGGLGFCGVGRSIASASRGTAYTTRKRRKLRRGGLFDNFSNFVTERSELRSRYQAVPRRGARGNARGSVGSAKGLVPWLRWLGRLRARRASRGCACVRLWVAGWLSEAEGSACEVRPCLRVIRVSGAPDQFQCDKNLVLL